MIFFLIVLLLHINLIQFFFSSFKVKDESIVKLTNQLHEMELKHVQINSVPPSPRVPHTPVFNFMQKQGIPRTNSNGISFDCDRGEFKEFVDVGVQTSDKASTVS